jgi:hypothetical protein
LQACELSGQTDFLAKYRDLFVISDAEVHSQLKKRCVDFIKMRRSAELTSIIDAMRRESTAGLTAQLRRGVSLLERVAIMHGNCYRGRNIVQFYETVTTFEELKMIVSGEYDIAPLIGYDQPIVITTVVDMKTGHDTLPKIEGEPQGIYQHKWIPSFQKFKKLCRCYPGNQLLALFPEMRNSIDKYCI